MDCNKTVGKRLEDVRILKGETQKQVADALGVKRETVNQWESNSRQVKGAAIIGLANHFSVSSDYILGLTGDPTPKTDTAAELGISQEALETLRNLADIPPVQIVPKEIRGLLELFSYMICNVGLSSGMSYAKLIAIINSEFMDRVDELNPETKDKSTLEERQRRMVLDAEARTLNTELLDRRDAAEFYAEKISKEVFFALKKLVDGAFDGGNTNGKQISIRSGKHSQKNH